MMGAAAGAVVLLLFLSAVLTAIHDAALQIGSSHVRTLADEGFEGAGALARVREREESVQAAVRVVTQAFNLTALAIISLSGVATWGQLNPVANLAIGVIVVLVVADLIPHLIAARRPVRLALSAGRILLVVERIARPLTAPVEKLEDRIGGGDESTDEQRELREIQEIGEEEGVLEPRENRLVERAFRLDELVAWDVMTPRVDIFAWNEEKTLEEAVEELADVPYSRVPVYRESVDDIRGIVYVREVYERYARGERETALADVARAPFFVPGSSSCAQLVQDFQGRRIHMGIVADEFGGVDGLVTLEDVLEELVGEIHDETDRRDAEEMIRASDDSVECLAAVDVRAVEEELGVTLPQGDHRSLNGFILDEMGQVPAPGESLSTDEVRIDILESSETQVLKARVTRLVPVEEN